jgi:hypothetical protein
MGVALSTCITSDAVIRRSGRSVQQHSNGVRSKRAWTPWKTTQNVVSHRAHTRRLFQEHKNARRRAINSAKPSTESDQAQDGKELFYLAPDGKLMAADVKIDGSAFDTGTPRALFDSGLRASFLERDQYVVTQDARRFLVNLSAEDENSAPITVVWNWEATLKK